jgi:hypothetical protein
MADILSPVRGLLQAGVQERYKDMGDGSYALVHAAPKRTLSVATQSNAAIFPAGAENTGNTATAVVPAGKSWRIQSIRADFTAGATVGNRFPVIRLADGSGNVFFQSVWQTAIVAAGGAKFCAFSGVGSTGYNTSAAVVVPLALPKDCILSAGLRLILTDSQNVSAAGDVWSNVVLAYEDL